MPFLEINDLSFSFDGKRKVLDGLSLELEKGTLTAILGPNGCGKTCLLDTLIGHHFPSEGEISVDGQPLSEMSSRDIALKISYVPQSVVVNIDYTVFDFILFGRAPHIAPWKHPTKEDQEIAKSNAKRLELNALLQKGINKISGGEQQLACIARALTQESPIILMDEPTSALDFGNQAKLFRIMNELVREGKTILFTTHNPNHIQIIGCDAAVMQNGEIKAFGNYSNVLTERILSEIYQEKIAKTPDGHYTFHI